MYHKYTVPNLENLQNSSITYFGPRKLPQNHILTYLNFRSIHHGPNLASTRHIFSFSCIQPCNPVRCCPTILSSPNQTPNAMLIINMHSHPFHAMSPCICNAMCHFMSIPCHIYDECYMDNSTHAYHPYIMDNYINQHKISKQSHILCQRICTHIYQHQQGITNQTMQWPYPYTNSSHVNTLGHAY